jgi:hypothetical protein
MNRIGRPAKVDAEKHPLHGHFNGEVPWLDGCKENSRKTCLDCPVLLDNCPVENPRLHKGGRPRVQNRNVKSL